MGVTHSPLPQAPVTAVVVEREDLKRENMGVQFIYVKSHGREGGSVHRRICVAY